MPFTPFHLGVGLLFGMVLFRVVSLSAFVVGSVIVDLEPFFVLAWRLDYPLHGFFHSFLGGSLVALVVSVFLMKLDSSIQKVMGYFRLRQEVSWKSVLSGSFLGVYAHIVLDSFIYTDIMPFFPSDVNPLYGLVSTGGVYGFCVIAFVLGIFLYGMRLMKK